MGVSEPYWQRDGITLYCCTIEEWCKQYAGEPFHALLSDGPYLLSFMGCEWDVPAGSGPAMQEQYRRWYAGLLPHLLPGAFGFAFGGSRTFHRIASGIEDAGFEMHPLTAILGWVFGQGFPKATRIDTQIDAAAGAEREVVGTHDTRGDYDGRDRKSQALNTNWRESEGRTDILDLSQKVVTAPATDLAKTWAGHRYGKMAQKPALEPIACFQRPYAGRPVECITQYGSGALWIDGARIGVTDADASNMERCNGPRSGRRCGRDGEGNGFRSHAGNLLDTTQGRWPSNVALVHSLGCVRVGTRRVAVADREHDRHNTAGRHTQAMSGEHTEHVSSGYADPDGTEQVDEWLCQDGCPVRLLDEQAGERTSGDPTGAKRHVGSAFMGQANEYDLSGYGDTGGASRFYHQSGWQHEVAEQLAGAVPWRYCGKASRTERDAGLDGLDSTEPVCYNEAWANTGQDQSTPADVVTPQPRATIDSPSGTPPPSLPATCLPMIGSGSKPTAPSLQGSKSTTSTRTSKTTGLKTLNSEMPSPTSASTAGASCEAGSGGSPAEPAESSSPSPQSIGTSLTDTPGTGSAKPATSAKLSATSKPAKHVSEPNEEAAHRVGTRNSHPT
mgnify:CR=1 FL=1